MKVFVAGSTGVLGRRVVSSLVSREHDVVGLSRSSEGDAWLTAHGAVARRGDLLDREGLFQATADCEAIIHLARSLPAKTRTVVDDWTLSDKLRTEGTRNLTEAGIRSACTLYIQSSVEFIYGRRHGEWVDETAPPGDDLPQMIKSDVEIEHIVLDAAAREKLPAIILRFGSVYSHDCKHTISMYDMISRGKFPLIEGGNVYWNLVTAEDAADAVVAAIENGKENRGKIFNICDDAPAKQKEVVDFVAAELGAPKPTSIPVFLAKYALGERTVEYLLQSARCINKRAKEELGWQPRFPSYRDGHRAIVEEWRNSRRQTGTSGAGHFAD